MFISEAVTMPRLTMITSIVSEESLVRDTDTHANTDTHTHRDTHTHTYYTLQTKRSTQKSQPLGKCWFREKEVRNMGQNKKRIRQKERQD